MTNPVRAGLLAAVMLMATMAGVAHTETKLVDLNARDVDQAARIIAGTARSMGVEVDL